VQQNTQEVFDAARGFNPQVFQGQRFAAQNPFEQQQIAALGDFGQAGVDAYQNVVSGLLGQDIGNPQLLRDELNTPMGGQFLDQVITDRTADVVNNLTSQFSRAGRLGSDAFGGALGRGIGTAVAPLLQQQENHHRCGTGTGSHTGSDCRSDTTSTRPTITATQCSRYSR
jgi:hypothetical protein